MWDGLFPSLLDFAAAVAREEPRALARLVQTYGLYRCAAAAGEAVWDKFPAYKRHIHPQRRADLERLWNFERSHAEVFRVVTAFQEELTKGLRALARQEPAPPIAELIAKVRRLAGR